MAVGLGQRAALTLVITLLLALISDRHSVPLTPEECQVQCKACVCRYEGGWICECINPKQGGSNG